MITNINQLDRNKTYSYADYLTWQFEEMVELIKGKVFWMSPAPSPSHQDVVGNIFSILHAFLKKKPCRVYIAPFDVRLPRKVQENEIYTVVQPDICVICDVTKLDERGCLGNPDLIMEILSPSTLKKDVQDKFLLYQESGVNEYWMVYPMEKMVEVFILRENEYRLGKKYVSGDKVEVNTLPGLVISMEDIFD